MQGLVQRHCPPLKTRQTPFTRFLQRANWCIAMENVVELTQTDKDLIESSWKAVAPIQAQAASLFYGRLFAIAPQVKPLFRTDIEEQGRKLMQVLAAIASSVRNLETLIPTVEALARRHVAYGVKEEHYAFVGAALLWTLENGLGDAFTPATRTAWSKVYANLSTLMIEAASKVE